MVFLKARTPDPEFPNDPKRIWRPLVGALEIHTASGSHLTIITEHAASTAAQITACMQNVKTQGAGKSRLRSNPAPLPIQAPLRDVA